MRRSQRPSQRSADSKLTTHTADSKLTSHTQDSKITIQTQDSKVSDSGTSYSISDPERWEWEDWTINSFKFVSIFRFEAHLDKDLSANKVRNAKKSGNLVIEQEAQKSNHSGQFLETPKQSPESEFPPTLPQHEEKEVKEKLSAKDRWAKGRAILKGGERESQKSQHSAASGGSNGSQGPPAPSVTVPNMVPRYGSGYAQT